MASGQTLYMASLPVILEQYTLSGQSEMTSVPDPVHYKPYMAGEPDSVLWQMCQSLLNNTPFLNKLLDNVKQQALEQHMKYNAKTLLDKFLNNLK